MKKIVISAISFLMILVFCSCKQEVEKQESIKQDTEIWVKPVGLEIAELPNKLSYFTNGTLDLTGLVVKVNNSDGSSEQLSKDKYIVQPAEGTVLAEYGNQAVKITAKGKTAFFNIYVGKTVYKSLNLKSMPAKTYYKDNEVFDTTGMEIVAAFDDGSERTLEAWEYKIDLQNGSNLTAGSAQKVNVSYCGKSVSFYINVGSTWETFTFVDDYENNDANSIGVKNHMITDICRGNTNLRAVVIPDTITEIESYAFAGCTSLENVKLPADLRNIKKGAFSSCTSLKSVVYEESLNSTGAIIIGEKSFANCENLIDFDFSANHRYFYLENNTFLNCYNIKKLNFEDIIGVEGHYPSYEHPYLGDGNWYDKELVHVGGFKNCSSLESVDFNNNNGLLSFEGCLNLKEIKNMKKCAIFKDCTALESIDLDNCTYIPPYAFCGCLNLTNINLPDSVEKIDFGAFVNCKKMTSIQIPYKVEEIYLDSFYGCENLKEIRLLSYNLNKINCDSAEYIKDHDIKIYYNGSKEQFGDIDLFASGHLNGVTIYCSDGSFVYGE